MSGLLMPSTRPNEDLDLLAGDYAAIRPATRPESKRLGLRWPQRAFAVVLRSCAGIQVVVFPTGLTSRFLTVEKLDSFIAVRGYTRNVAVLAFALRIYPNLLDLLREDRGNAPCCEGCNCIWQPDRVFDPASSDNAMVAGLLQASFERAAA